MSKLHIAKVVTATGIVLGCSLAACQPTQTPEKGSVISDESISSKSGGKSAEALPAQFAAVCTGTPVEAAAPYQKNSDTDRLLYAFYRPDKNDDYSFMEDYFGKSVPETWRKDQEPGAKIELVLCTTEVARELEEECEFKDKDYMLELYEVAYRVSLREAKTGEVIESTILEVSGGRCPYSHTFRKGEYVDTREGSIFRPLKRFVKPYVESDN